MALRLLYVTKGLDIGGLERVVVDLASSMAHHGHEVDVAVVNNARNALAPDLERAGVPLHWLRGTDTIGWQALRLFSEVVSRGEYDIVHAHGPLPAVLARVVSGRRPVVSTVHTMWRALRRETRAAWAATATLDATTIAVSGVVRDSLPRHIASRTRVIPHGIDVEAIRRATGAAPATRADTPTVTAITVASHRRSKDYPTLLRALKWARDAGGDLRLVAIGEGLPHYPRVGH